MNILVLGWRGPKHPSAGGAEQVVHEHCKGWVKAGHCVTLFTSKFKGSQKEEIVDGIKIIRRSFQYWGVQISAIYWYFFGKHEKYDLVVDQFHGIPFFTPLYVKAAKLALIQEVAGKVWLNNDLIFPFNLIIGLIGYLGEPILFLLYKKVTFMTGSQSAKNQLVKIGIPFKNIYIINHGVIVYKPIPIPKKEKTKTVMYLGAITRDKGIRDVLKTFYFLSQKGDYNFWIVGKSSDRYKKYVQKTLKKMGISKSTKYFGYVDQKTKFKLLARAHVLINPSILEGWGLVNIEANTVGTPVVTYNSPGLVDSVKDGKSGIIVSSNTPQVLANSVDLLLKNKIMYNNLTKSALFWSENFDWDKSRRLSLNLLDQIYEEQKN